MRSEVIKGVIICVGAFAVLFGAIYVQTYRNVKQQIDVAKSFYDMNAEDALIAFLLDESRPPSMRTHVAVWTLGQIRSPKALKVLNQIDRGDPEGISCKGSHATELCQYEVSKAIKKIENWGLLTYHFLID